MDRRMLVRAAGAVVVATMALAGCGDDEPSEDEAQRQVCEQRDAARQAVADLGSTDLADLSVDDLEAAADRVEEAVDDLGEAADALGAAGFDEVRSSVDTLLDAVGDLNTDEPLGDQLDVVASDARAVADSWRSFVDGVSCG